MQFNFYRRQSLSARIAIALSFVIAAVLLANFVAVSMITRDRLEVLQYDKMRAHAETLAALVQVAPSGELTVKSGLADPVYKTPKSGRYWQISKDGQKPVRSQSLGFDTLSKVAVSPSKNPGADGIQQSEGSGPTGPALVVEQIAPMKQGGPLHILVATDQTEVNAELLRVGSRSALVHLLAALLLLPLSIWAASRALTPFRRLGEELKDLDEGKASAITGVYPKDVEPAVRKLNGLIAALHQSAETTEAQADLLAHNVRTSLSVLLLHVQELEKQTGKSPLIAEIEEQCSAIQRCVTSHAADAYRHAEPNIAPDAATLPEPLIEHAFDVMQKLHDKRGLEWELGAGPTDGYVRCGERMLREVLYNLLDNAGKWAMSSVRCEWRLVPPNRSGSEYIDIEIRDDGPGYPHAIISAFDEDRVPDAGASSTSGARDDARNGLGLGLCVSRDFLRQNGGDLLLSNRPKGGARAVIRLPRAFA